MTRADVLDCLKRAAPELKRLGFSKLYLFGSLAREADAPNDVDLLYEADAGKEPGFGQLVAAYDRLEQLLGCSVDLVDKGLLHDRIRDRVEAEMIEVF
jgi:predicted nucleotidyltransferase